MRLFVSMILMAAVVSAVPAFTGSAQACDGKKCNSKKCKLDKKKAAAAAPSDGAAKPAPAQN